ncbi:MAG TPA: hypothetical protein VEC12_04730, partial [Bacteroidia bacterium]|nr:hypothetical protein [Bacteroidia bacterium]
MARTLKNAQGIFIGGIISPFAGCRMFKNTFKAFKSRNYRLYFAGQSVSLIGTWMQQTAVSWVIYSQTHS